MDINRQRNKKIIDRTLPEVFCSNKELRRIDILNLSRMLNTLGVDFIEVDLRILEIAGELPAEPDFLYRVDSESALEGLSLFSFKAVVINSNVLHFDSILNELGLQHKDITIEVRAETIEDLKNLRRLKDKNWIKSIRNIRIIGLNRFVSTSWLRLCDSIKRVLGVSIDICPENIFYNATASAVDAIMDTADCITASFTGYGGNSGYAAIEQVLAFVKVMTNASERIRLNILPDLARVFSEAAGIGIPENMPVIGENIFRYESGIHADGISKNPMTYEPYDPEIVGQKRKLSIGKHSGRKSVMKKLQELGIEGEHVEVADFLKVIRERSISLQRNLEDNEIIDLLKLPAISNI
ncbi:MAG: citramalate synthase [Clostridia bacterium]|nr:citramalate synthase [Clostridia bacterium]